MTLRSLARVLVPVAAVAVCLSVKPALAQAPAPPDYSKVEIQASQLAPNFYRLEAVGPVLVGNAGILTGPDGVLLVDEFAPVRVDRLEIAVDAREAALALARRAKLV